METKLTFGPCVIASYSIFTDLVYLFTFLLLFLGGSNSRHERVNSLTALRLRSSILRALPYLQWLCKSLSRRKIYSNRLIIIFFSFVFSILSFFLLFLFPFFFSLFLSFLSFSFFHFLFFSSFAVCIFLSF